MPPKLSKEAKQARIVAHLRQTGTCHTLKELEKSLPGVAAINSLQVKEYLQELADEGRVRVEKIGSGNWWWCFGADEVREREERVRALEDEVDRLRRGCEEVEAKVEERRALLAAEEEAEADGGNNNNVEEERQQLLGRKARLQDEVQRMQGELRALEAGAQDRMSAQRLREETEQARRQAQLATDNIYVLEGYVARLTGGDRAVLAAVQRECYGEEYVEGEGLREIF
ncbi:meiotic nuclear division protein 1 [Aspergillus ellipticus CBS 707.79]|uniref:Meiotic nuclear division protein 1 n=1 Tax=Aspergillus ellipticus CBS 707.79 TaxID=1448320 RepID=A0A319CY44_9EURO|nr:meiotic nuclear division protein 1 [Aspergillus ellipticus CBS 707.79]